MRRIAVIAITAGATLATFVAVTATVFSIQPAIGGDGWLLLRGKEASECRDGGGCAVMSEREFNEAVLMYLSKLRKSGVIA